MDFGTLLSVAQKNEGNVKQPIACYQTKFTPPKKQTKQTKALSENIKKFLARKEEEERQKALEEKKKKENLLALRDHKAQSRINKHLKVCKAANKSVLADAIDNENTAVTMAGPSQPDEDDYGYVSQEASAFYNQLMSKYNTSTSQKPMYSGGKKTVKDIASTKDRVKQALKQQEIDEALGHRRKRKSASKDAEGEPITETEIPEDNEKQKEEKEKPKKRKMAPPPIDFGELLKIAEKKQHETIVIEPKPKVEEPERLMTKKQMKEYAKEKEWREKREREKSGGEPNKTPVQNKLKPIPKISSVNKIPMKSSNPKKPEEPKKPSETRKHEESKKIDDSRRQPDEAKKSTERGILRTALEKIPSKSNGKTPEKIVNKGKSEKDKILEERKKLEEEKRKVEEMRLLLQEKMKKLEKAKKEETKPDKTKLKVEKKEVRKEAPKPSVSTMNGKPKQFPPPDLKPIRKPMKDMKKPVSNKRRIYDDEEEYDSELDDFIDDEVQEDGEDYSKYISEIFGYDKSKYRNVDEDDAAMESSFAQQLKEEYVSTKIGIMEDLEDIRMEALEKKRKAMLKKKLKK